MWALLVALLTVAPQPLQAAQGPAQADPRLARSGEIADRFQRSLGAALNEAMARGGPVSAIEVCAEQAPGIAENLSEEVGAKVSRTGLRLRNPKNAPDRETRRLLLALRARLAEAKTMPTTMPETFVVRPDGSARYLRAITTQPMCLTCHGRNVSPAIRAAIARRYPRDQATGFETGELRGAFLIDWAAKGP